MEKHTTQKKGTPKAQTKQTQAKKPAAKQKGASVKTAAIKDGKTKNLYLWSAVVFVLLFVAFLFGGSMTMTLERTCGLISCIVIIIVAIIASKRIRPRIGFLFLSVTAYVAWALISTTFALSGKFALSEASKLIVAYAFFIIIVAFIPKKTRALKCAAYIIAGLTALVGLLSVDAATMNGISGALFDSLSEYTQYYSAENAAFSGARIGSFITNSNVYGELMCVGVITSFWLAFSAKTWKERLAGLMLVAINLFADILAMSLVSLLVCFVACLAMALLSKKGDKLSFIVLEAETAVAVLVALVLSYSSLGEKSALPLLCCIASGLALFGLDSLIRVKADKRLRGVGDGAAFATVGGVIVLAAAVFVVLTNTSAPYEIAEGSSLTRSVRLEPGEYEFNVETDRPDEAYVVVISYSNAIPSVAKTEELSWGAAEETISVTVPEDSVLCNISVICGPETAPQSVTAISYTGQSSGSIAPAHKLLPDFITNRLQVLSSSASTQERAYLFKAAADLFVQRPITGLGLGGFENGALSVLPFFLETKYAHNHYLQALCDLGIIGFLFYICILVFSVRLIWKSRKNKKSGVYCPIFTALIIALFGGALSDVCWSSGNYLPVAFIVLALAVVFLEDHEDKPLHVQKKRGYVIPVIAVVFFAFGIAVIQNISAEKIIEKEVSFDSLKIAGGKDIFSGNDYRYSYVVNAAYTDDQTVAENARKYADILSKKDSNTMGMGLAQYYFENGEIDSGFACLNNYVDRNRAKAEAWQNAFELLKSTFDPRTFDMSSMGSIQMLDSIQQATPQIQALAEKHAQTAQQQLDKLPLNAEVSVWLSLLGYMSDKGLTELSDILDVYSTLFYDSRYSADFDEDGLADPMYLSKDSSGNSLILVDVFVNPSGAFSELWFNKNGNELKHEDWDVLGESVYTMSVPVEGADEPYVVVSK